MRIWVLLFKTQISHYNLHHLYSFVIFILPLIEVYFSAILKIEKIQKLSEFSVHI